MFWTPLEIVGTSLGPDLGFGVVYLRILWDSFGISVGHVGTCWDMFGDFSDLDQKSMTKHSRSQIPTVGIRESANVGFRIPHSGELGTRILTIPFRNPHSGELGICQCCIPKSPQWGFGNRHSFCRVLPNWHSILAGSHIIVIRSCLQKCICW